MKKSSRIFIIGIGILFVVIISGIVFLRITAGTFPGTETNSKDSIKKMGILESKELGFDNFTGLVFFNVWDVQIKTGNEYKITLTADRAIINKLNVTKLEDQINFSYDMSLSDGSGVGNNVTVEIIMPVLKSISFGGLGNIHLRDFKLNTLEIANSGATNIEAENVSIEQLFLKIDGAANADFSNIKIKNCKLDVSGAANIELNMTGGELSGEIRGASRVTYRGYISKDTVLVSGIGSLKKE